MMDILPIILYILGSILLIVLIILGIKLIVTMNKIENVVDDINGKMKSLNGFFSIIDFTTDKLSLITERFVDAVSSLIRRPALVVSCSTSSLIRRIFNRNRTEENNNE